MVYNIYDGAFLIFQLDYSIFWGFRRLTETREDQLHEAPCLACSEDVYLFQWVLKVALLK